MESYIHLYKTNEEFTAAYNGPDYKEPWLSLTEDTMAISYSKPKLTAITFDSITWVTDIPSKGGTATKDNCSFKVYAKYDNGISVDISSDAIVTGELVVPSSTADQRQEVGQLTLTASYSGLTATGNVTVYQAAGFSTKPLTFNILSAGTINWVISSSDIAKTIDYKLNDAEWTSITSNTGSSAPTITVNPGDKVQFRGNNEQYGIDYDNYNSFSGSTASFEAEGNIMSLIYGDDFKNKLTISSTYAFKGLFSDCVNLVSAENLVLPATTLADDCYDTMFGNCTSLTTAPELPATTLATWCYYGMFQGCASLTTAPALPATTLADYCYSYMFWDCTSLTTAPELPATTLADSCYDSMFDSTNVLPDYSNIDFASSTVVASGGLKGLFSGTKVTDNDLERLLPKNDNGRYYLPVTTLANYCYQYMFYGCSSLTTAPALPATTLANNCYSSMFYNCTSLTTAPELPATKLANYCYSQMFYGCTNLNYIKCLATDISASNCTTSWVDGVASTGTFVQNPDMDEWETGVNGIPVNWTVEGHGDFSTKPLTFNILSAGTINWTASDASITKTIEYKLNNGEWTSIISNTGSSAPTINVIEGDKVQFRGSNTQYATSESNYNSFSGSTALFKAKGNIMSLIYGDDFKNKLTISSTYAFTELFRGCTKLVSAKNLILPATTLANYCYRSMFQNCTSLTIAPKLPATTLADYCYYYMFDGCTSLTTAPKLPATNLIDYCYGGMFYGCTSLTTAPELPATTLANNCYNSMFMNCTSLTTAPELSATTLADSCYLQMFYDCTSLTTAPSALPATTLASNCYSSMFNGCTSLTTAPTLPSTILANNCYSNMFRGCTKLTTSPKLPATTLANGCYSMMFRGCTSLTTAPTLPATTLADYCYDSMFIGCTSLTTAPALPATTLGRNCYSTMFSGCRSLTTAPALPATTLADYCYDSMFYKCTKLNYIKCLATNISATNCTSNWVSGVASTGTFVKAAGMTSWTTGTSGIPTRWTVQNA